MDKELWEEEFDKYWEVHNDYIYKEDAKSAYAAGWSKAVELIMEKLEARYG
jgi:hypothetical protein